MILFALLAVAQDAPAEATTALAAEAAMAAAARTDGTDAAIARFAESPSSRRRRDPAAEPRSWWPMRAATACDGAVTVVSGRWREGANSGGFIRVWKRQPDGRWKWTRAFANNEAGTPPGPDHVATETASCDGAPHVEAMQGWSGSRDETLAWRISPTHIGETMDVALWTGDRYRMVATLSTRTHDPRRRRRHAP